MQENKDEVKRTTTVRGISPPSPTLLFPPPRLAYSDKSAKPFSFLFLFPTGRMQHRWQQWWKKCLRHVRDKQAWLCPTQPYNCNKTSKGFFFFILTLTLNPNPDLNPDTSIFKRSQRGMHSLQFEMNKSQVNLTLHHNAYFFSPLTLVWL
jgi:hypothetical protein